jgi:hypothetical protein
VLNERNPLRNYAACVNSDALARAPVHRRHIRQRLRANLEKLYGSEKREAKTIDQNDPFPT